MWVLIMNNNFKEQLKSSINFILLISSCYLSYFYSNFLILFLIYFLIFPIKRYIESSYLSKTINSSKTLFLIPEKKVFDDDFLIVAFFSTIYFTIEKDFFSLILFFVFWVLYTVLIKIINKKDIFGFLRNDCPWLFALIGVSIGFVTEQHRTFIFLGFLTMFIYYIFMNSYKGFDKLREKYLEDLKEEWKNNADKNLTIFDVKPLDFLVDYPLGNDKNDLSYGIFTKILDDIVFF